MVEGAEGRWGRKMTPTSPEGHRSTKVDKWHLESEGAETDERVAGQDVPDERCSFISDSLAHLKIANKSVSSALQYNL